MLCEGLCFFIAMGIFALVFAMCIKFVEFVCKHFPKLQQWVDSFTYDEEENEV